MGVRRTTSVGLSAVAAVVAVSLTLSSVAFAAVGTFRHCHGEPLNDLLVTPGVTFRVTVATICQPGYSTGMRNVPESEKNQVYVEYGITHRVTGQYEIDHLISLELGGSNAIGNLWPELNDHPHGYLNSKDILENRLHSLCTGKISLRSAQTLIASNWVTTYHRFLGAWPKANAVPPTVTTTTSASGPTATSLVGGAQITSVIGSVAPGSHELLTAHSNKPGDSCPLTVTLPSGRKSTESGLGATAANASGDATWTWLIGSTTGAGTAQVSVICSAGSATGTFIIK